MVGLFSRFSARGSRRTQSALEGREELSLDGEAGGAAATTATTANSHGIEVAVEFKPIEHPIEPLVYDAPIQCPMPEPSILNDGRIWKKRVSANARRRADLPIVKDVEGEEMEPGSGQTKQAAVQTKRRIIPSVSAPEHSIQKLLEECNTSGI